MGLDLKREVVSGSFLREALSSTMSYTYAAVGQYTATVTATNSTNSVTATTTVTITDVPVAGLALSHSGPTVAGATTYFTATVLSGSNVAYTWNFGDGHSGAGPQASHIYTTPGVYTVTLTAQNSAGVVVVTKSLTVQPVIYHIYLPLVIRP
jgi:PKD repeat protein